MKLLLATILICLAASTASSQQKQINWLNDFNQARIAAAQTVRPMLLDFTAVWCKACREMETIFWTRADVIEAAQDFVCVKIDLDANGRLADKYGVSFLPNIVVADAWGNALVFHRGFGRGSVGEITGKLNSAPKDFSEIKEAAGRVAAGKNARADLSRLADFYQQKKFYYLSSDFYKRLLKQEKSAGEREKIMLVLGFNYLKIGWSDDARLTFERFQKEFPASARADEALFGKFSAAAQKNLLDDAAKILSELKAKFPSSNFVAQAEENLQAYRLQTN